MVAEVPEIPAEALPTLSMRAEMDTNKMFLVFDCDARNLNLPSIDAAPYLLDLSIGPVSTKSRIHVLLPGTRDTEATKLKPVLTEEMGFDPIGWEAVSAQQILRPDGVWRVTVGIPRELLEKNKMGESLAFQANWRQLTGESPDGQPAYLSRGGLILAMPGRWAEFFLRSPLPTDVAPMLQMLADAPEARCADRCLRRLLWLGRRDEALRGAMAMAMEHANPAVRAAAARVWIEWSFAETPGLPELKAKAKAILESPEI